MNEGEIFCSCKLTQIPVTELPEVWLLSVMTEEGIILDMSKTRNIYRGSNLVVFHPLEFVS